MLLGRRSESEEELVRMGKGEEKRSWLTEGKGISERRGEGGAWWRQVLERSAGVRVQF
jgi:hypothetical protein